MSQKMARISAQGPWMPLRFRAAVCHLRHLCRHQHTPTSCAVGSLRRCALLFPNLNGGCATAPLRCCAVPRLELSRTNWGSK